MAFGLGAEMASSSNRQNIKWELGFAALFKFRACEGHCCPSRYYIEDNFKLGQWVSVQRYRKDFLTVERKRLLRAIGFVWNAREQFWEQNFAALLKFKRRGTLLRTDVSQRKWFETWMVGCDTAPK